MALPLDVVIMAAGKGTRMKSSLPKVLHRLGGRALLAHVIDCAGKLSARRAVVITGHGAIEVEAACARFTGAAGTIGTFPLDFVRQEPQLGTGHAVQQAVPLLADDGVTLVLSGDVPLTQAATLQALIDECDGQRLALLTLAMPDPTGYGRIVRAQAHVSGSVRAGAGASAQVRAIVEHKDATDEQRKITEIYSGIMAVPTPLLRRWLARLDNQNAQNEYYLTDIVKFAVEDGVAVVAHQILDAAQVAGVNWVWTPNSGYTNEARFGYNRLYQPTFPDDHALSAASYGLNTGVTNPLYGGLPRINVLDLFGFPLGGIGGFNWPKVQGPDTRYLFVDHVSHTIGKHAHRLKFSVGCLDESMPQRRKI